MEEILEFVDLLRLIDERSTAFRAVVASAPSLDVPVPSCPEWTLFDLVRHLGEGRRRWAAIVAAGPADSRVDASAWEGPVPSERTELLAWVAESTRLLLDALREAGPDRGCWVPWVDAQSPRTSGAVARHQVQEVAVHTYDAQLAVGAPQPLPEEVAVDGVEEFQLTCCATTVPWPFEAAILDYHAIEGRSWRVWLSADGVRTVRLPAPGTSSADPELSVPATATATATASDLVLAFYDRVSVDTFKVDGDRRVIERLDVWDPSE